MGRVALFLIFAFSFLHADWCIVHATQKSIHDDEDKIFFQNFPKGVISKKGEYYRFESGPYRTKKEALAQLKKARKFNPDAYIKECSILIGKRSARSDVKDRSIKASEPLQSATKQVSSSQKKSPSDEGIYLEKLIAKLEKKPDENYEEIGFYEYLDKLLKNDFKARGLRYEEKLSYIEALIENSVYDWDFFANVAVRYSKFIDYNFATNKELTFDAGLGLNKRIFDSGSLVKERLIELKKRLGHLKSIDAKDKLSLYGLGIYAQALLNQRTKELYEELYYNQKAFYRLILERQKAGLASRVDVIDAKNDLLDIKKSLLVKIYNYLYSDFLLRTSADINSTRPLKLKEFGFGVDDLQSDRLFEKAFHKNISIQKERTLLALKKSYLKRRKKSYLPIVDFNSALFYEYKKDFAQDPVTSANGLNYLVGLNLKFPIYSAENRGYLLQKAKIDTLLQRYRLLDTIKKTSQEVQKYSYEIRRLRNQLGIVDEQIELTKEKQELVKKRYINGLSTYRQYSDAVRKFLTLHEEKVYYDLTLLQDSAMLKILEGDRIFYGED